MPELTDREIVYKYAAFRAQFTGPIFDVRVLPFSKERLERAFLYYESELEGLARILGSATPELDEVRVLGLTVGDFKSIDPEDSDIVMQINGSPRFHKFRGGPIPEGTVLTEAEKQDHEIFQTYFIKYALRQS